MNLDNEVTGSFRLREGSSRVVEIAPGKKVVLRNTRKVEVEPSFPDPYQNRQPGYFQSRSGLFGASKLDQIRQFFEKK